jgi:hypothetical protein
LPSRATPYFSRRALWLQVRLAVPARWIINPLCGRGRPAHKRYGWRRYAHPPPRRAYQPRLRGRPCSRRYALSLDLQSRAIVRGPVQSAVSADRRQCHARSLRAPQASALPELSGVALERVQPSIKVKNGFLVLDIFGSRLWATGTTRPVHGGGRVDCAPRRRCPRRLIEGHSAL